LLVGSLRSFQHLRSPEPDDDAEHDGNVERDENIDHYHDHVVGV
jgi:hypothetical protein